ncbi:ThiF family adenylyltransferase (plasmid) [Borreliella californiensis]|uniref:Molybdopterin/thiamine biosynthesis adenylyltransferase n=1 Tax=Borreliella californiensis TaxID=373543 RepID=A0A7W9ZNJ5_9SPIR|nr:ThiF family adenylyltransferase [Borreliella californiensis]MBB6213590.1 molybdopterin/thiamine biosynthesis adenylyltransferase [Borreliella californiensis]MBB6213657.1 molybdopterin/thiamine biosynthesis adenylyltransferase [Borreliella californiensis]
MVYIKNPTSFFNKSISGNLVNLGNFQIKVSDNVFEHLLDIAIFAKNKKTYKELILFATENNISDETVKLALENKVLIPFYEHPKNRACFKNKYFLDLLLENPESFSLEKEHIIIVGCGGIGNFMTYSLSTLGLGAITFIDEDEIEESNLNRQFLFNHDDIGSNKVDVIEEKIKSLNKAIQTKAYKEKVSVKLLKNILINSKIKPALIVLSADDDYCLPLVNKFCIENSIPLINIGYLNDFSVIGPFYIPNISSCYYCTDIGVIKKSTTSKLESKIILANKDYQAPSFFTNNAIASSMAIIDIIFYFGNEYGKINSLNKRIGISNHNFSFHFIDIFKNKSCKCNKDL